MRQSKKIYELILLSFTCSLLYISCKKLNVSTEISPNTSSQVNDFFKTLPNTSPAVLRIIENIKDRNNKKEFVNNFGSRNGYPIWNKILQTTKKRIEPNNYQNNVSGGNSTDTIIFIPLLLPNDSVVNGYIKAVLNDSIMLSFSLAKDYKNYDFSLNNSQSDATNFAYLNMQLNSLVFGINSYKITDPRLFSPDTTTTKTQRININDSTGNQNNLLTTLCSTTTVTLNYCGSSWCHSHGDGSCQDMNNCPLGLCYSYNVNITNCITFETPSFPSGGGSTGGTGGGGQIPHNFPCIPPISQSVSLDPLPPCPPPTGGSGWIPISANTTVQNLEFHLGLNSVKVAWLDQNPSKADDLLLWLAMDNYSPEAKAATNMTIEALSRNILQGPYDNSHYNFIKSYIPNSAAHPNIDPIFWMYFSAECAILKAENPTWSDWKVYWEASKEIIHLSLDVIGLVPVIGEVADLANGIIYTIQGDGVNATLSFAATIPIAGWAATATKFAKKTIIALNGTSRTLKWYKEASGLISFGNRGLLRKVLGLAVRDLRVAHHIIPWEHGVKDIVQKAAGHDFHLNEILNGIPLTTIQHNGSHALYNQKIGTKLDNLWNTFGQSGMSVETAAAEVRNLANQIRNWIVSHPNESINNIIL